MKMQEAKEQLIDIVESPWPIYIYFVVTAFETVGDVFALHWKDGFSGLLCASAALIAGGLIKTVLFRGDAFKKIGGIVLAVLLMFAAHHGSDDFSIILFSHKIDGVLWCYLGAIIGFLFTNKRDLDIGA